MIKITNNKIAGFAPRWAEFRGLSLLFDNPFPDDDLGLSFDYIHASLRIRCSMYNPRLRFYKALKAALDEIGVDLLTNRYLFCPLPPESYHVTAWDGVNYDNIDKVHEDKRLEFESFLGCLPYSIDRNTEFTRKIRNSSLATATDRISFKFEKLTRWTKVLVARLEPADEESNDAFKRIAKERLDLNKSFKKDFGVRTSYPDFSPHVSLGYFTNSKKAKLAGPRVNSWTKEFNKALKKADYPTISFESISLYGFTDMATFFKRQTLGEA